MHKVLLLGTVLMTSGLVAGCATGPVGPTQFASDAVPGPSNPDWQAEFRDINLSGEQVDRIRNLKAVLSERAFGQGFNLGALLAMARGPNANRDFDRSPMATAIREYNAGVRQVLTPPQFEQWRRNGGGER